MKQLFSEFVEEEGEFQPIVKNKPLSISESSQEENERENNKENIRKNDNKKIETNTKLKKKPNIIYEEILGNHNEFISGGKNEFDFKKFIQSTDPQIKENQKIKVFFLIFENIIIKFLRLKKLLKKLCCLQSLND